MCLLFTSDQMIVFIIGVIGTMHIVTLLKADYSIRCLAFGELQPICVKTFHRGTATSFHHHPFLKRHNKLTLEAKLNRLAKRDEKKTHQSHQPKNYNGFVPLNTWLHVWHPTTSPHVLPLIRLSSTHLHEIFSQPQPPFSRSQIFTTVSM